MNSTIEIEDDYIGASPEAIQHHYDVSNDFYGLWLDETYSYSCAFWKESDSLETAQLKKLDYHAKRARAIGVKRVLDIGCGWGAMLKRLVDTHSVERAIGLTLSKNQLDYVRAFHHPKIDARLESWVDHIPTAPYDSIVSMGAFEHFARLDDTEERKAKVYRLFFNSCRKWLKPGGWLSLQTITYENSSRKDFSTFFEKEIFPETDIPRLSEIVKAADRLFEIEILRNDRKDYERTVREWRRRLKERKTEAIAMVGQEVFERYDTYLQLIGIGFQIGTISLVRIAMRRLNESR